MSKPYIEVYQNQNNDAVIVYVSSVKIGEIVEPEHMVISECHIDEVIKSLNQYKKEML